MIGWKRTVVTVGEKSVNTYLFYGQGATVELVAMTTIGPADMLGLLLSTTYVLSSGVAGNMAAIVQGLQWQIGMDADPAGVHRIGWIAVLDCSTFCIVHTAVRRGATHFLTDTVCLPPSDLPPGWAYRYA